MLRNFFCFDLYTTGLLIGWLGLAESITSCIFSILMLENVDTMITPKDFPEVTDIIKFRSSKNLAVYPFFVMQLNFRFVFRNHYSGFYIAWPLHSI